MKEGGPEGLAALATLQKEEEEGQDHCRLKAPHPERLTTLGREKATTISTAYSFSAVVADGNHEGELESPWLLREKVPQEPDKQLPLVGTALLSPTVAFPAVPQPR